MDWLYVAGLCVIFLVGAAVGHLHGYGAGQDQGFEQGVDSVVKNHDCNEHCDHRIKL